MPIPVLALERDLLPPLPDNGPMRAKTVWDIEQFARRFERAKSVLLAASSRSPRASLDSVVGLRNRHPLVPLVLLTTTLDAAVLVRRLAPNAVVTAPATTDAVVSALRQTKGLPVRQRLAQAIERRHHLDPNIVAVMAACCRSQERLPPVWRMMALAGFSDSTFYEHWTSRSLRPEDFLHLVDVIRAIELWESGVLMKDIPRKLGISDRTFERRKAGLHFEKGLAERLAKQLLRRLGT
jgi:hypothetical protein